jgi:hypothetical protein
MRWVACLVLMSGCASSGETKPTTVSASAPMVMSGDRCQNGICACRAVDDFNRGGITNEQGVPPGHKRFEIRTGRGLDPLEITVAGKGTLTKSTERVDAACGYIDLPPGKHKVRLRAQAKSEASGMVPGIWINEWGERTHDWYETFNFRCGGNAPCTKDHMTEWAASDGKRPRGIFDPCGSVRVENLQWDGKYASDVKVLELELDFVLEVYKFVPRFPHGNKTCKGPGGVEAPEEPKDLPQ